MNLKYNESQIIELYNQGLSDKEISDILGVTETAFACKRRKMGLKAHTKAKREDYIPNEKEIAIIIGTLLGDSTIRYVHEKCKYPNLTFVHSPKQEEYFNYLSEELKNFRASSGRYVDHNKLNKYGYKLVYTGRNMKCLKTIRDRFYPNGKKITIDEWWVIDPDNKSRWIQVNNDYITEHMKEIVANLIGEEE